MSGLLSNFLLLLLSLGFFYTSDINFQGQRYITMFYIQGGWLWIRSIGQWMVYDILYGYLAKRRLKIKKIWSCKGTAFSHIRVA